MKRDFRVRFPTLPPPVGRESRAFVHLFIMDVIKWANVMSVDELSERVQRHYQVSSGDFLIFFRFGHEGCLWFVILMYC